MKSFLVPSLSACMRFQEFPGKGPPLVVLHGLGCAASFEFPHVVTAPSLTHRHAVLLDLLGSGYSDHPAEFTYEIADHANLVVAFIRSLGADQVDLFGHSMGGAIAIEAAHQLGPALRNLIVAEANLDAGGGQFSKTIAAAGEAPYLAGLHDETITAACDAGNHAWAATMQTSAPQAIYRAAASLVKGGAQDWRQMLYDLPHPKTFIFGAHSLPHPDMETLPRHGIATCVVPGAGHSMGVENPGGLADCIAKALPKTNQR